MSLVVQPPPRPKAVCGFEKNTCGWKNDGNNWQRHWRIHRELSDSENVSHLPVLCLSANQLYQISKQDDEDADTDSSWVSSADTKGTSGRVSGDSAMDIQARLWSPTVPSTLCLRCLTLVYSITLGSVTPEVNSRDRLPSLALLQRQEGLEGPATQCVNDPANPIVYLKVSAECTHSQPSPAEASREMQTPPRPKAVCGFEKGTCGWTNDGNNWQRHWRIHRELSDSENVGHLPVLCLTASEVDQIAKQEDEAVDADSLWASDPDAESPSDHVSGGDFIDIQARLWSPTVRSMLGLRCLTLAYSIRLGSPLPGMQSPPRPKAVCGFEKSTCGWTNDGNNWQRHWRIHRELSDLENAAVDADSLWISNPETESPYDNVSGGDAIDIQARLWSPTVPSKLGLRCLTLAYSIKLGGVAPGINGRDRLPSLALLQRQEGTQGPVIDYINYLANPIGYLRPSAEYIHQPSLPIEVGSARSYRFYLQESVIEPMNDLENVGSLPVLCLTANPIVKEDDEDAYAGSSWLSNLDIENPSDHVSGDGAIDIQVRLWSPTVPSKLSLRCLALAYSIKLGSVTLGSNSRGRLPSLALLQRQEGFASITFFPGPSNPPPLPPSSIFALLHQECLKSRQF
ncbi:unnamed protein product [Dibothriocephalus latus]|uniref:MAM domain-containing protein n=1 Tax=Dibothriocephalus latus TaxID=60516 RepID=A0A3P7LU77_DIBLA|nr:unnamed protein product [Dibothriocephalus latus]